MTLTYAFINRVIDTKAEQLSDWCDNLAADYREKVIVPYCKQRNFEFVSGMGGYSFYDKHGDPVDDSRIKKAIILTLEINMPSGNHALGTYILDVRREQT